MDKPEASELKSSIQFLLEIRWEIHLSSTYFEDVFEFKVFEHVVNVPSINLICRQLTSPKNAAAVFTEQICFGAISQRNKYVTKHYDCYVGYNVYIRVHSRGM